MIKEVWVFNGANSKLSSGVFVYKEIAEAWIKKHKLTGLLTLYPINKGVYDWAIDNGMFTPKQDTESRPSFIQKFTSASQEHIIMKMEF